MYLDDRDSSGTVSQKWVTGYSVDVSGVIAYASIQNGGCKALPGRYGPQPGATGALGPEPAREVRNGLHDQRVAARRALSHGAPPARTGPCAHPAAATLQRWSPPRTGRTGPGRTGRRSSGHNRTVSDDTVRSVDMSGHRVHAARRDRDVRGWGEERCQRDCQRDDNGHGVSFQFWDCVRPIGLSGARRALSSCVHRM